MRRGVGRQGIGGEEEKAREMKGQARSEGNKKNATESLRHKHLGVGPHIPGCTDPDGQPGGIDKRKLFVPVSSLHPNVELLGQEVLRIHFVFDAPAEACNF